MKRFILSTLPVIFILSGMGCDGNQPSSSTATEAADTTATILPQISRVVTESEGLLQKNIEYVKMIGPVEFTVEAAMREDSTVALRFNYYHPFTFKEHLQYQGEILPEVFKDFNKNQVTSVFLGRLIYTGNLAAKISAEVKAAGWDGQSYPELRDILEKGSLTKEFRSLFRPYGLEIKTVSFEKAFFTDSKSLAHYSKLTLPPEEVPAEILDCMAWLIVE